MDFVKKGKIILFIGDSVTDCGRNREDLNDLGQSYVKKIDTYFKTFYVDLELRILNQGISGNRTIDLQSRWRKDCLDFKPDMVNILIGINDCWRRYDGDDPTSMEAFKSHYDDILSQIAKAGVKISMMEPFVMPIADKLHWREDLDPKIQVVRSLARKYHALLIPLDGLFASLLTTHDTLDYSADGVHPNDAGHAVIARAWLSAMQA